MTNDPLLQIPDMFPETIAAPKFKRGDVVRLNATNEPNGVLLTVSDVIGVFINCMWHTPDTLLAYAEIHEDCLSLEHRQDTTTLTPVPCMS